MSILRSEPCVGRFIPKEWTGIQGFPPLDLQAKEDFPPFHKVRSRPINPRLCEHAKRELPYWVYVPSFYFALRVSSSDYSPTVCDTYIILTQSKLINDRITYQYRMKQSECSETNNLPRRRLRIDPSSGDKLPTDQSTCRQEGIRKSSTEQKIKQEPHRLAKCTLCSCYAATVPAIEEFITQVLCVC